MARASDLILGLAPAIPDLPGDDRTIVAIATAPGRSALAIVRISGPAALEIAGTLLHPAPTIPNHLGRCAVRAHDGSSLDDAMAVTFHAPRSFTGEDLVEITIHGGAIIPAAVVSAALNAGAHMAEPGEFTRRAVLNGKLDLLQAEAVGDLIDARSSAAHHMALRQLDGGLTKRITALRHDLLALEAMLAYDIDFPEEDDGPVPRSRIEQIASELHASLEALLATGNRASQVQDGALVVLAGAPNAGKSSLFNALLGEARAIVTEIPGTTRDAIEAVLDVPGWPLRLVDTAGLRDTTELVEQLGIEATTRYMARAAIVLHCVDASDSSVNRHHVPDIPAERILTVRTKCDLVSDSDLLPGGLAVSAYTGAGLHQLLDAIAARLAEAHGLPELEAPMLTRVRHQVAVQGATDELSTFLQYWQDESLPVIVIATHVRRAAEALSDLIGVVYVDDVLDVVFRSFCVGK